MSPPGFRVTRADSREDPTVVDVLTYSDGLASYSVFIETMPEAGAGSVVSRNGATVVLTHVADCEGGDHLVTRGGRDPGKHGTAGRGRILSRTVAFL